MFGYLNWKRMAKRERNDLTLGHKICSNRLLQVIAEYLYRVVTEHDELPFRGFLVWGLTAA